MSINNSYSQINLPNNVPQVAEYYPASAKFYQSKRLSEDVYTPSNGALKEQNTNTIPIQSLYTPKQLLIAYSNPHYVNGLIKRNPNIGAILKSVGLKTAVYPENIANIYNSHITTTTSYAMQIANEMNIPKGDKQLLEQACVFHDFGKILIPSKILNKPGILTEREKGIVDIHAELGYELLSKTGMNKRVLELIRNHHNPMADNADTLGQILSVADIYSALREVRSYKNRLSEQEALYLLDQKAEQGEVSTEVVDALKTALTAAKSV